MADRKNEFVYGSMSVPSGEDRYRIIRWGWGGLNKTDIIDSGDITDCDGVEINGGYVDTSPSPVGVVDYAEPIGVYGFDDWLLVLYRDGGKIKADCRYPDGRVVTGVIGNATGTDKDFETRSVIQFNVLNGTENIVSAQYDRKLLVFPDKKSFDFAPTSSFTGAELDNLSGYPNIHYATVYGSRVFGVDNDRVYASSFNDYANWNLDTAENTSDSNAWCSTSQSNVKADGDFTGIWTYDNHVVLFKKDFTQLVYNNKNPFRIVDVCSYGADNQNAICEVEGTLYFASGDMVYAFTGGQPKAVSESLGNLDLRGCALGGYRDRMYVANGDKLYRYRDGVWSEQTLESPIKQFATNENGLYGLTDSGIVLVDSAGWVLDGAGDSAADDPVYGDWWFETDFMAAGRLDVRRVKKMTVLCDIASGSTVKAYLLKDGEVYNANTSRLVLESHGSGWRTLCALVRGVSADMHRVRFVGRGRVRVHALELQISWGGDLYKER